MTKWGICLRPSDKSFTPSELFCSGLFTIGELWRFDRESDNECSVFCEGWRFAWCESRDDLAENAGGSLFSTLASGVMSTCASIRSSLSVRPLNNLFARSTFRIADASASAVV